MAIKKKVLRRLIELRNFCADKQNSKLEIQKAQQDIDTYEELIKQL
jgi:hypothetical protein